MIVDLFAGPGGWDVGASLAGLDTPIGLELCRHACTTRAAAGHDTIRTDVAIYPPEAFRGVTGLLASPPCQEWSSANTKKTRLDSASRQLVYQVMRWARIIEPEWIACEQVRGVLPVWHQMAAELRQNGYSADARLLCAADYGVPQRRYRAILIAHRDRPVAWPIPTHSEHSSTPWVTMADALGHTRPGMPAWCYTQPATTVMSDRRIRPPGHHGRERQPPGTIKVTIPELGILQGFNRDYPWSGSKQGQQVGNAIPPPFAAAILAALTGAIPGETVNHYQDTLF